MGPSKVGGGLPTRVSGAVLGVQELKSSGSVASLHCLRPTASVEGCRAAVPQVWHPGVPRGGSGTLRSAVELLLPFPDVWGREGDLHVNLWGRTTLGLLFAARSAVGLGLPPNKSIKKACYVVVNHFPFFYTIVCCMQAWYMRAPKITINFKQSMN